MIIVSKSSDPFRNLAVEEHLLSLDTRAPALFLWQSENAVVIGKNQNAWKECRLDVLRGGGGILARRVSGGGAVYHDRGNLNCTLIRPRPAHDPGYLYALVQETLADFGIAAKVTGGHCLSARGRKFSGNAFCLRKHRALHHCTLLVHTDIERLNGVLRRDAPGLTGHAVDSVPASVMNLAEAAPALTVTILREALIARFRAREPDAGRVEDADGLDASAIARRHERHASWEWNFGYTPDFEIEVPDTGWTLRVRKGRIAEVRPDADGALTRALAGCRFDSADVIARIAGPGGTASTPSASLAGGRGGTRPSRDAESTCRFLQNLAEWVQMSGF